MYDIVGAVRNKHLDTNKCCTSGADGIIRQWALARSIIRKLTDMQFISME
jgi:hypothetical protein